MKNVIDITILAKDMASKTISGFKNTFHKMATAVKRSALIAVGAITAIGVASLKLASDATRGMDMTAGFARNFGKDTEKSLQVLREASKGTINDIDLMASSNKAALLGVATSTDELAKIMEVARLRGKAMGMTTTQAFDDLVTGIGRQSPMILDNLGIAIPKAFTEMTEGMDGAEKKQALLNLVMQDGAKLAKEMGGDALTTADKFTQMKISAENLRQEIGERLMTAIVFLKDTMLEWWQHAKDKFAPQIQEVKDKFQQLKSTVFEAIGANGSLKENLRQLADEGFRVVLRYASRVLDNFINLFNWIKSHPQEIKNFADGLVKVAKALVKVSVWVYHVGEGIYKLTSKIRDAYDWLVKLGSYTPTGMIAKKLNIGPYNQYASGTTYAEGGLSLVGEQGAELINLPRGSRVYNANETQNILNNSNKQDLQVTNNFYGTDVNADDVVNRLSFQLNFL